MANETVGARRESMSWYDLGCPMVPEWTIHRAPPVDLTAIALAYLAARVPVPMWPGVR